MTTPLVFVSYCREDEAWKDRLVSHLRVLQGQGILEVWDDRRIEAGALWNEEISAAMSRASVAVLLVSEYFLTSEFVREHEIPRILERRDQDGLRVVPIIVRPCPWENVSWLRQIQLRPPDGIALTAFEERAADAQLAAIAREIADLVRGRCIEHPSGTSVPIAPESVTVSRMPVTDGFLVGRGAELEELNEAWRSSDINVLSIVAWGGVGKSALMNHWLGLLAKDNYRGAVRVYTWSFYLQGTEAVLSADDFIAEALQWFGDSDPTAGSEWARGARLARLVAAKRTLMLLDGLEPLQHSFGPREGFLRDKSLAAFLTELAGNNLGLCVISSRLGIADLRRFHGTTIERQLDFLSPDAGAELLRKFGVQGDQEELRRASEEYGGHGLALTLLATYLRDAHNGDVSARDEMRELEEDDRQGGHARRVMESYERQLEPAAVSVLSMVALFDRPVRREEIDALCNPPIEGLTDNVPRVAQWSRLIERLRRAHLLLPPPDKEHEKLDAHPLVRAYFNDRLRLRAPQAFTDANARLYEFFRDTASEQPATLAEMDPLLRAVAFGCRAGRHRDALHEVFLPRIMRGPERYATSVLGANSAILAALTHFLEGGDWRKPVPTLDASDRLTLLEHAAPALLITKGWSSPEVLAACETARTIATELGDSARAFRALLGLWSSYSVGGRLRRARELAVELLRLADASDSADLRMEAYMALGHTEFWLGHFPAAVPWLDASFALYDFNTHYDPQSTVEDTGVICACYKPVAAGMLGYLDDGERLLRDALEFSEKFRHTFNEGLILWGAAWFYAQHRNAENLERHAVALRDLAAENEFIGWAALARTMRGWAAALMGHLEEGINEMTAGRSTWISLGGGVTSVFFATLLGDACTRAGRLDEATEWLRIAEDAGATEGYYLPEVHRVRAELLHASRAPEAEVIASLKESMRVAREQGARLFESRTLATAAALEKNIQ